MRCGLGTIMLRDSGLAGVVSQAAARCLPSALVVIGGNAIVASRAEFAAAAFRSEQQASVIRLAKLEGGLIAKGSRPTVSVAVRCR